MKITVGCPVAHRAWALPDWFDHVRIAAKAAGVQVSYVFVVDPNDDSFPVLRVNADAMTIVPHACPKPTDARIWNQRRYSEMVELRNLLLKTVRMLEPELFLSLDSDILLHPNHLASMIEGLGLYDAVGGKCYMTPTGTMCPSYAKFGRNGELLRQEATGLFEVDVIMAAKLMTPSAYHIDYQLHPQGEDAGWSKRARAAGLKLGWDGRFISKHVMAPGLLDVVDRRVGW